MKTLTAYSPAKINRTLGIGEIQENALHTIDSEIQKISLYDTLSLVHLPDAPKNISFSLVNPHSFCVPSDERNIVFRAAQLFLEDLSHGDIFLTLTKTIPVGAGLGGGSSNAAHILLLLEQMFPGKKDIHFLGTLLGSDVSCFLHPQNRMQISGTGEKVLSLPSLPSVFILLVKPKKQDISTKWAYEKLDEQRKKCLQNVSVKRTGNDFEDLVFSHFPEIKHIQKTLQKLNADEVHLCGSGSTVYALFSDEGRAKKSQEVFLKTHWTFIGTTLQQMFDKEGSISFLDFFRLNAFARFFAYPYYISNVAKEQGDQSYYEYYSKIFQGLNIIIDKLNNPYDKFKYN